MKIKQLKWVNNLAIIYMDSKNDCLAYEISPSSCGKWWGILTPTDDDDNRYMSLEGAKIAAQTHFERFIRNWIEE